MAYSKETLRFADSLVFQYATFDKVDKRFVLDETTIPDFDIHALSALIVNDNPSLANEACGCDNPAWNKMQHAMFKFMNSTAADDQIEFAHTWKEGVASYCMFEIHDLLDRALEDYNFERRVA